jgi:hypothetical protein
MAGKGGKTIGAGRKPNQINLLRKSAALGMLSDVEEKNQWRRFLKSSNEDVAFKAFIAWNERAFGKPHQSLEVAGTMDFVKRVISDL